MHPHLKTILDSQSEIVSLQHILNLLYWDMRVNMPADGMGTRGEQIALIEKQIFERQQSPAIINAADSIVQDDLSTRERRLITLIKRKYELGHAIPSKLIQKIALANNRSTQKRIEAIAKKDYRILAPALAETIELTRESSDLMGVKGHPYNGQLLHYEYGMTVEKLTPLFHDLKKDLLKLLQKIEHSQSFSKQKVNSPPLFDPIQLEKLSRDVLQRMGLRDSFSRLDHSAGPFSVKIAPRDIRVTSNFQKSFLFGFRAAMHEGGHALYELNVPSSETHTILGDGPSYGIHESQSRFWECVVGQSKDFWAYYLPKFKKAFNLPMTLEEWYPQLNQVIPTPIRTTSDEIHYGLHIILRYEMECDILAGKINSDELNSIWNEKTEELIGIRPKDDTEGVLQDGLWSSGSFGYFPSYLIGNIYAGQIYSQIRKDLPNYEGALQNGDYDPITTWLKTNIHQKGAYMDADDIIREVCGSGVNATPYVNYLTKKYSEIYSF